jgi:galactose mutarotase-like enzyme
MYLNLLKKRVVSSFDFLLSGRIFRSGMVTGTLLGLLIVAAVVVLHERGRGHLSHFKEKMDGSATPDISNGPRPGGADAIVLTRTIAAGTAKPEFSSVTLLPGLGAGVLQIDAYMPGNSGSSQSGTPLLSAPDVAAMAASPRPAPLAPDDLQGTFQLPWAGALTGILTPLGSRLAEKWMGQTFTVPVSPDQHGIAQGGLLAGTISADVTTGIVPDGSAVTATFQATDFGGHWPGATQTKVHVLLEGPHLELTVTATNSGNTPEPLGIGWIPRFVLPGNRADAVLKLPEADTLEQGEHGLPTGRIVPANPTLTRFMDKQGARLGNASFNSLLVQMRPAMFEDGPIAALSFPTAGYGLRVSVVSSSIRAMRVIADPAQHYLSLGAQTNYDDPLGREWDKGPVPELTTLAPGQSMEWKIKLEIFPLNPAPANSSP